MTLNLAPLANTNSIFNGTLTGNGALTINGPGEQTLSGTSTYTGGTTLTGGTLAIGSAGALGGGGLVINAGNLDTVAGNTTVSLTPVTFGNLYINFLGTGNLAFANSNNPFQVGNTDFNVNVVKNTLTIGNATSIVYTAKPGVSSGNLYVAYVNPGPNNPTANVTVAPNPANTTQTNVTINLATNSNGSIISTASQILNLINSNLTANSDLTVALGSVYNDPNAYLGAVGPANINTGAGQTQFFEGGLVGSGNLALSGNGTLFMQGGSVGSNATTSFTGNYFVGNGSTLDISSNTSLGANPGALVNYLNMVNGSTLETTGNTTLAGNQSFNVLNGANVTIDTIGNASNLTITYWAGNGNIIKTGSGNLTSAIGGNEGTTANTSSFSGNIIVQQGFLISPNSSAAPFGSPNVNVVLEGAGGGLWYNGSGQTYANNIILEPNPNGGSNFSTIIPVNFANNGTTATTNNNINSVVSRTNSSVVLEVLFPTANNLISFEAGTNFVGYNGTVLFSVSSGNAGEIRLFSTVESGGQIANAGNGSITGVPAGVTMNFTTGLLSNGAIPQFTNAPLSPSAIYDFGNATLLPGGAGFTLIERDASTQGHFDEATIYMGDLNGGTSATTIGDPNGTAEPGFLVTGMLNLNSTWNGVIEDAGGGNGYNITKTGTGTWTWTNSQLNSGLTTIQGGTLQIGNGGLTGALGFNATSANVYSTVLDNANLSFDYGGNQNVQNPITGPGTVQQIGTGILTLNGNNTYTGTTIMTTGTIQTSLIANAYVPSPIGASSTLTAGLLFNGGTLQYVGNGTTSDRLFTISPNGGFFDASGVSGNLTGNVTNGTISILSGGTAAGGGAPAALATNTTSFAGETLYYTGAAAGTADNGVAISYVQGTGANTTVGVSGSNITVTLKAGGDTGNDVAAAINSNPQANALVYAYSGALVMTNPGNIGVSGLGVAENLTLTGNGTGDMYPNIVDDGAGQTSIFKTGTGTWTLDGNQTYSGLTTVSNGILQINGTLVNSNVLVTGNGNLSNINNNGVISQNVTVQNGGMITPGNGVIGILTAGNVTLNGGGIFNVEVNPVGGNLTYAGTSLNTSLLEFTHNLTIAGGSFEFSVLGTGAPFTTPGTYAMFELGPNATIVGGAGSFNNLNWQGAPVGFTFSLAPLAGGNSDIYAATVAFTPSQGFWTANTTSSGNWSVNANWDGNNSVVPNAAGAQAVFPAIQSGPYSVIVDGNFTIGNLTLSGANAYTLNTANGTQSLTMNNSGNQAILFIAGGNHTVNVPLVLAANIGMNIDAASGTGVTLNSPISDANGTVHGNITLGGAGNVSLFGNSTYSGTTALNAGTTIVNNANSLGVGGNIVLGGGLLEWASTTNGFASNATGDISMNGSVSRNITIVGGNATFDVPPG